MFTVSGGSLRSIGESPSYLLDQVTVDLVKTAEGRRRYFDFLSHHREIAPVHKLYGIKPPSQLDLKIVSVHVKKLCVHIHPDKNSIEEYSSELFKMVWEAKEAYGKNTFPTVGGYLCQPHAVISLIKNNKWCQAEILLRKNTQVGDTVLDLLFTAVCLCLGDFEGAIENVPPELTKVTIILEKCRIQLSDASIAEERIQSLTLLLEMLSQLTETYMSEKLSGWPSPGFFDQVIPHKLFVLLKECFKSKNDPLMYERYLRDAIRHCPDGIQSDNFYCEKLQLINELNEHMKRYYRPEDLLNLSFIHEEMRRLAPLSCKKILFDTFLDEKHKEKIASLVDGFCSKSDTKYLDRIIHKLEAINDQSTLNSVVGAISAIHPKTGQKIDNYARHSPETNEKLNLWLSRLRGWAYYLNSDKERAAHYFLEGQDYMSLGCTLVEMGCFAEAIAHWSKNIPEEAARHIFLVMNFCDTLHLPESAAYKRERLGQIDEAQFHVLKSFYIS